MSYIWWFIKAVFKLVLLAVVIVAALFYYQKDDKATVTFNDGSEFSIQAHNSWGAADDDFIEWFSRSVLSIASNEYKNMFAHLNYIAINEAAIFSIIANDFDGRGYCANPRSGGKKYTDIVMPAGNVFYCNMPRDKGIAGYDIDFFYPVAADKIVTVVIDSVIWQQHSNEIYAMLKTATYTPKQ